MTAAKRAKKKPLRKKKPPRKVTPPDTEVAVLTKSLRRCTLCFYLKANLKKKHGQIAHLNGDRSNFKLDNLAWMCMKHHSIFDSTTSQHKNYTLREVKDARAKLYKAIAKGKHLTYKKGAPAPQPGLATDTKTLDAITGLMTNTMGWLRGANFAGWSFDLNNLNGLEAVAQQKGSEHEFIDAELEALRKTFHAAATQFLVFIGRETFPLGNGRNSIPEEWELDRPEHFQRVVKGAHEGADLVCSTYDDLVRAAKRKLSA